MTHVSALNKGSLNRDVRYYPSAPLSRSAPRLPRRGMRGVLRLQRRQHVGGHVRRSRHRHRDGLDDGGRLVFGRRRDVHGRRELAAVSIISVAAIFTTFDQEGPRADYWTREFFHREERR